MKRKRRTIEESLDSIDRRLADADGYVERDVNVEGRSFLHFGDWRGQSGHPKWMKNVMIPALRRGRARKEKILEQLDNRAKDKRLRTRRQGD
jgi:hypothetical protein